MYSQTKMRSRRLAGLLVAAGVGLSTSPAAAWYFPEHTELTRVALQDYAPAFVTRVLSQLVDEARSGAFGAPAYRRLCPGVTTRLDKAVDADGHTCVPYGALAALAGDHANYGHELGTELAGPSDKGPTIKPWRGLTVSYPRELDPIAVMLTEAAQSNWISFQSSAPRELVEVWTVNRLGSAPPPLTKSLNPHDYVRTLDAALLILDPGYTSRARGAKTHFHDATASVADVLQQAVAGDFDNALAQLMAHHLKSLQLAVESRNAPPANKHTLRVAALFEHAFALHFMEDGLAGGHIATDPAVTVDERRAQRHDYFNRQGLAVRRSLLATPCDPSDEQTPSPRRSTGLSPCWVAHGDGFATSTDRAYVAEAAARVQTEFALALLDDKEVPSELTGKPEDLPACKAWSSGQARPPFRCDVARAAFLLDPFPEWTRSASHGESEALGAWAVDVVHRYRTALAPPPASGTTQNFGDELILFANAGSALAQPGVLPPGIFGQALISEEPSRTDPVWDDRGLRIVRPLLVAWPAAQSDVTTLAGADIFHRGWQAQIAVNAAFSYANPAHANAATSVWAGVGGGIGFAAQGVFPTRVNRTLVEANVGVAQGYYLAGSDVPFRSLGVIEVRAPVTSFAVYGAAWLFHSRRPLELLGEKMSWGLLGARIYATLGAPRPLLTGWDAEIANLYLGTPGSTNFSLSGITASELRIRLGWRSLDFDRMHSMFDGVVFIAAELSSGFYTTFL